MKVETSVPDAAPAAPVKDGAIAEEAPAEGRPPLRKADYDTEGGFTFESYGSGAAGGLGERSSPPYDSSCLGPNIEIWTQTEDQMLTELVKEVAAQLTVARNIPDRLVGLIGFRFNALSGQARPVASICNRWKNHLRFSSINPSTVHA